MQKIEKEIKVTRYVAFDGTEFETEQECLNNEGSAFGVLMQQLDKCMLGHYLSTDRKQCYCLFPKTRHDIFVLGQIMRLAGNEESCAGVYEHLTLLSVRLKCNTVVSVEITDLEDYIRNISDGQFAVACTVKPEEKK